MPPRRAARGTTLTPRGARSSAAPPSTRANTPGRTTALESTPLPDVEAEQSFAYGSSNTKPLPQQLVARRKMTIKQMAETLDAGIFQAEKNFQAQREEAQQYGMTSADARAARAARRSSDRESKDSSVLSESSPVPKRTRRNKDLSTAQTENWLHDIQEEPGSQDEVVLQEESRSQLDSSLSSDSHSSLSRHTNTPEPPEPSVHVEASSMPEVNQFDQTYSREREIGRGLGFDDDYGAVYGHRAGHLPIGGWDHFKRCVSGARRKILEALGRFRLWMENWDSHNFSMNLYKLGLGLAWTIAFFVLLVVVFKIFCEVYCETPWSIEPSRSWHHRVNSICRYSYSNKFDKGNSTLSYYRASTQYVDALAAQIKDQQILVRDLAAKYANATATIKELTENQEKLLNLQSDLQTQLASAKASQATVAPKSNKMPWLQTALTPIFRRINYVSPGHGAAIDPYLTSPTKEKHFPFYQRLLLGPTKIKKYQSPPPIEALKPWSEVGDCWCAAATHDPNDPNQRMDGQEGRYVQLSILLEHEIFPDEVVIEHLPLKTTVTPGSAPKDIEVWADFSHLSQTDFASLMIGPHPLNVINWYPQLAMIGKVRYDAIANQDEGKYVQIFRLEFNQQGRDEVWTKKLLFRVASNWGAANTCIYRVRVHGVPVRAHLEIVGDDD